MEITEVTVFLVDRNPLKAIVSIVIDDCFVIRDLKIIRGANGHFVDMPSKWRAGQRREMVSTINVKARNMVEERVFAEYEKTTGESLTRRKLGT